MVLKDNFTKCLVSCITKLFNRAIKLSSLDSSPHQQLELHSVEVDNVRIKIESYQSDKKYVAVSVRQDNNRVAKMTPIPNSHPALLSAGTGILLQLGQEGEKAAEELTTGTIALVVTYSAARSEFLGLLLALYVGKLKQEELWKEGTDEGKSIEVNGAVPSDAGWSGSLIFQNSPKTCYRTWRTPSRL